MPTFVELDEKNTQISEAIQAIAVYMNIGAISDPNIMIKASEILAKNPGGWGFPRSWAGRPNWESYQLCKRACLDMYGKPVHPNAAVARQWRGLPNLILLDLWFGYKTPQRLAGLEYDQTNQKHIPLLTKKEAHDWLTDVSNNRLLNGRHWRLWLNNSLLWLAKGIRTDGANLMIRSRKIALWLKRQSKWNGWWSGMPCGYGPDGRMAMVPVYEMIDEVWDADLHAGEKSNPERVFRRIIERQNEDIKNNLVRESVIFPTAPFKDTTNVKQVRSSRSLVHWGNSLNNCSAGYAEYCYRGEIFIYIVNNTSMVEMTRDGIIKQHRAYGNNNPSSADRLLLQKWITLNVRGRI